ncbi:hypothetical protein GCM10009801_17000 [Streptomyces albiaxialis]|uniref:Uncharacterized protein n=1 Tax=Streptomyces albiaxialis TaxID=329523 RepID=A0ABN2VPC8_9ACTN
MNRTAKNLSIAAGIAGLLLTAAPTASASTVETASVSARGYIQCKVKANIPHDSHGKNGWIVGKSQFGCTAPVDSVTNVVKLQKKVKGKWVDATKSKARNVKKPKAGTKKYRNQTRNYTCRKGTFRTASMGHGVYRGVPSKSRHWTYSKSVKNPCK